MLVMHDVHVKDCSDISALLLLTLILPSVQQNSVIRERWYGATATPTMVRVAREAPRYDRYGDILIAGMTARVRVRTFQGSDKPSVYDA